MRWSREWRPCGATMRRARIGCWPPERHSYLRSVLAAFRSAAVLGIDAYDVTVEVDVALGLPQWMLVGLPASAVTEGRERVGAALVHAGGVMPPRRFTVKLAPADVKKEGTGF